LNCKDLVKCREVCEKWKDGSHYLIATGVDYQINQSECELKTTFEKLFNIVEQSTSLFHLKNLQMIANDTQSMAQELLQKITNLKNQGTKAPSFLHEKLSKSYDNIVLTMIQYSFDLYDYNVLRFDDFRVIKSQGQYFLSSFDQSEKLRLINRRWLHTMVDEKTWMILDDIQLCHRIGKKTDETGNKFYLYSCFLWYPRNLRSDMPPNGSFLKILTDTHDSPFFYVINDKLLVGEPLKYLTNRNRYLPTFELILERSNWSQFRGIILKETKMKEDDVALIKSFIQ
jgi:hypothetical protein